MPFSQNINIAQLVASLAMIFTMFGIDLDPKTQAAIVALIVAGTTVITWVLHTFVNHPANKVAAEKMVSHAVASVKGKAPSLLAFMLATTLVLGSLTGCTSPIGGLTPQQTLLAVEAGFALAEATYDSICSVNTPPGFCADTVNYNKAKLALEAAFKTAQAAISASGNLDSASIQALMQAVAQDWATYNQLVNTVQAKDAARRGVTYQPIPL